MAAAISARFRRSRVVVPATNVKDVVCIIRVFFTAALPEAADEYSHGFLLAALPEAADEVTYCTPSDSADSTTEDGVCTG